MAAKRPPSIFGAHVGGNAGPTRALGGLIEILTGTAIRRSILSRPHRELALKLAERDRSAAAHVQPCFDPKERCRQFGRGQMGEAMPLGG